ncbi:MAG: hypothetical protein KME29_15565 [Calothrix sp. FI2-JRJ7]|nr:hypothetical protein [Calothrix sp. FI2-JRJ7]
MCQPVRKQLQFLSSWLYLAFGEQVLHYNAISVKNKDNFKPANIRAQAHSQYRPEFKSFGLIFSQILETGFLSITCNKNDNLPRNPVYAASTQNSTNFFPNLRNRVSVDNL